MLHSLGGTFRCSRCRAYAETFILSSSQFILFQFTYSCIFLQIYLALAGRLVTLLTPRGRTEGQRQGQGQGEETAFSPAGTRGEFNFYSLRRKNCLGSKDRIPGCHFPRFGVYLFGDSTVQLFLSENSRNCC